MIKLTNEKNFAEELVHLIYNDQMQPVYPINEVVTLLISTVAALIVTSAVEPTKAAKANADALVWQVWQSQEVTNTNPTAH